MSDFQVLLVVLFCILGVVVIAGYIVVHGADKNLDNAIRAQFNLSYDEKTQILTLQRRASENKSKITVLRDAEFYNVYHPEKYVYTGASVGGITMGSVHKEEAYYTQGSFRTGGGWLVYKGGDVKPIRAVKLSGDLLAEAKKRFPVHSGQIITMDIADKKDIFGKKWVLLPYEDVKKICDFICGK